MKSTMTKLMILFISFVLIHLSANAFTAKSVNSTDLNPKAMVLSNVSEDIDGRPYGNGEWIGYVFTNPGTSFYNPSFDNAVLHGTFTESATFNRDWGADGPTVNDTTYSECFLIRYKMTENLTKGRYMITLGGDDGVRLTIDGGSYLGSDWSIHGYRSNTFYYDAFEDGNKKFVFEFYENGGGAHASFSYARVCDLTYKPLSPNVTFTKNATNISWDSNGNLASTTYSWYVYDQVGTYIQSGTTTNNSVDLLNLVDNTSYYFTVFSYTNCSSSETTTSNIFTTPNIIRLATTDLKKVSNTSITCGGDITRQGASPVMARGVCWSTSPHPTIADNKTIDGTGIGIYTSTVEGLSVNGVYYLRAYATNNNETAYGDEIVFSPSISLELGVFYGFQIDSGSSHIYVDIPGNASVTEQGICWSVYPYPTISDFKSNNPVISGVVSGTTYYVRPYINCEGVIFYGNQKIFKMPLTDYIVKSSSSGSEYGTYTFAGIYNEKPYFLNSAGFDGLAISYMYDYWAFGLAEDYGEVWLEFENSFDPGNPPLTGWYDLMLIPKTGAQITFDATTLTELPSDNGSFNSTFVITHNNANGQSFEGADNEDFVSMGKVIIHNLPNGLTATAIRNNALQVTLNITGSVTPHADVNDDFTGSIAVEFQNNAFTNGDNTFTVGNYTGLNIDFIGTAVVTGAEITPLNGIVNPVAFVKNSRLIVGNLPQDATIRVYDVTGKMMISKQTNNKNSYETELKSLGIYIVQVVSKNRNWNFKCIND